MSRNRTMIRVWVVVAGVALAAACGGDSTTAPTPVPLPPDPTPVPTSPTTVTVSPLTAELDVGETVQLAAVVRDQNSSVMAGATVTWTSSASSVATVDPSGLVTGVAEGTATITASVGDVQGTAEITVVNPVASSDREILVELYNATDGPNWIHDDNWLTDAPLGSWYGVEVDARGRVTELDLSVNNLSGSIPPELGKLASLEILDLSLNLRLSGPIPPELGNLTNLTVLWLGNTGLSGPIPPELGRLTSLEILDFSGWDLVDGSNLSGPIPPELGNLTNLKELDLGHSNLSGPIPPELGNLTSLEILGLSDSNLSGPIPPELGNLTRLEILELSDSNLSGPIPPELGNLTRLERLQLAANELTGLIPQSFLALDMLTRFSFGDNAGLCAPNTTEFVTWLQSIDNVYGPFCAASSSSPNRLGSRPDGPRTYGGG